MSGHAILDSCHHCGKAGVELFLVDTSRTSWSCSEATVSSELPKYHHIHVFVACGKCKADIWDEKEPEPAPPDDPSWHIKHYGGSF